MNPTPYQGYKGVLLVAVLKKLTTCSACASGEILRTLYAQRYSGAMSLLWVTQRATLGALFVAPTSVSCFENDLRSRGNTNSFLFTAPRNPLPGVWSKVWSNMPGGSAAIGPDRTLLHALDLPFMFDDSKSFKSFQACIEATERWDSEFLFPAIKIVLQQIFKYNGTPPISSLPSLTLSIDTTAGTKMCG